MARAGKPLCPTPAVHIRPRVPYSITQPTDPGLMKGELWIAKDFDEPLPRLANAGQRLASSRPTLGDIVHASLRTPRHRRRLLGRSARPALDLVARGELDVIVFECIGERTLAFGHRDRMADPRAGYNALLERRLRAVLPACVAHGTRLVTNMGVANPRRGGAHGRAVARELGLKRAEDRRARGRRRPAHLLGEATPLPEAGITVRRGRAALVGANAYLGADAICRRWRPAPTS